MVDMLSLIVTVVSLMENISTCELDIGRLCPEEDSEDIFPTRKSNKNSGTSECDPISATLQQLDDLGREILDVIIDPFKLLSLPFAATQNLSGEGDSSNVGSTSAKGESGSTELAAGSGTREPLEIQTVADNPTPPIETFTETLNPAEPIAPSPAETSWEAPLAEKPPSAETLHSEDKPLPAEKPTPAEAPPSAEKTPPVEVTPPPENIPPVELSPSEEKPLHAEVPPPTGKPPPAEEPPPTEASPSTGKPPLAENPPPVEVILPAESPSTES